MKKVLVSIVTFNAAELTTQCLASLEAEMAELPGSLVSIADNGSTDGAAEGVEQAILENGWDAWARFHRAERNGGFAFGNNVAIRAGLEEVDADYVLLLNPDTVLRPRAIRILLEFLESHPSVGIAGGLSEDEDTTPQHCFFRFHSARSEFASHLKLGLLDRLLSRSLTCLPFTDEPCEVGWVSGALMMIRRQVLQDVGLLDEGYFLYYEETDLTLRARRAGWSCWHVPSSRVIHYVGHSTGVVNREGRPQPQRRPAYWFEARRRYFSKNHSFFGALLADLAAISGLALWKLRCLLERKVDANPPHFLRDHLSHCVLLRGPVREGAINAEPPTPSGREEALKGDRCEVDSQTT